MVVEIRLPPLGQTSDEMRIVEWYKKEGDRVELAEPLLCVETDKANVDVESADEGVILKIIAQLDELLPSGSLLAYLGELGDVAPEPSGEELSTNSAPAAPAPSPSAGSEQSPVAPEPPVATVPEPRLAEPAPAVPRTTRRAQASPAVRKLATDLGVDLATVTGTGPGGLIQRADVERVAPAPPEPAPIEESHPVADGAAVGADAEVSRLRRIIARRLTRSAQTIPAFRITADLDATVAQRELAAYGKGLTHTHLLLRSVARALQQHPVMLRLWIDDGPAYRTLPKPNVGLAVAGEDSLYVVTIPTPHTLELRELVGAVSAAVTRGRKGRLNDADQELASITISNLGMFDVDQFDAIIDPDQNAILAVATAKDRVVAHQGMFMIRSILTVTLAVDHRAVDGAQAAQFLRTLKTLFETNPVGKAL